MLTGAGQLGLEARRGVTCRVEQLVGLLRSAPLFLQGSSSAVPFSSVRRPVGFKSAWGAAVETPGCVERPAYHVLSRPPPFPPRHGTS